MGAYAAVADIEKELGLTFDVSSKPSATTVDSIITRIEGRVNGTLEDLGFTVPFTQASNPKAYAMVRDAVIMGVCARVLAVYSSPTQDFSSREEAYWRQFTSFLLEVSKTPLMLSDAAYTEKAGVSGIDQAHEDYQEKRFSIEDVY